MSSNANINRLVVGLGNEQFSIKELMEKLSLKDRKNFLELYLNPAMEEGIVRMLYPESPRHPRQRYLLTVKGQMTYSEIVKKEGNK